MKVIWVTGHISYEVSKDGVLLWHHHIDQLHRRVLPNREDSHSSATMLEPETSLPEDDDSSTQSQEDKVSLMPVTHQEWNCQLHLQPYPHFQHIMPFRSQPLWHYAGSLKRWL